MRILLAFSAVLFLFAGTAAADPVKADIVWVIDDSVSMAGDIAQVKANIVSFNTAMVLNGIDANYALVRYGGPNGIFANYGHNDHASLEQDMTDFATFNMPGGAFQTLTAPTSAQEKGSLATIEALTASFRAGSIINIILVTDEDDDSSLAEFLAADAGLTANDALFNFIGRPGVGNTNARYGVLAANHGGAAFDILAFRANPVPFFQNFTDTKVKEILEAPEPGSIALLLIGVGALALRRRKSA